MKTIPRSFTTVIVMAILTCATISCSKDCTYDYYTEACKLYGQYNGPIGNMDEHDYFICLSDKGFDSDSSYLPGVVYYYFDIFSRTPADKDRIALPEGHYTLGSRDESITGTFTPNYSIFVECTKAGNSRQLTFSKGFLNVSRNDGEYVLEAELTDVAGMTHYLRYQGPMEISDNSAGAGKDYSPLNEDLKIDATSYSGSIYSGNGPYSNILMSFTEMPVDADGHATMPGSIISLDCCMILSGDGSIPEGQYTVSSDWGSDHTVCPGEIQDGYIVGSIIENYDTEGNARLDFVREGTMSVLKTEDGLHYVTFALTTATGHTVSGSYHGDLPVPSLRTVPSLDSGQERLTFRRPVTKPVSHSNFSIILR